MFNFTSKDKLYLVMSAVLFLGILFFGFPNSNAKATSTTTSYLSNDDVTYKIIWITAPTPTLPSTPSYIQPDTPQTAPTTTEKTPTSTTTPPITMEKPNTGNLPEYYKQRAENWVPKKVARVEPITLTAAEIDLIERVVELELSGNNEKYYNGKVAIANVILNRLRSDYWEFPDTIFEVLYQEGQFYPAGSPYLKKVVVSELTKKAVKDALDGYMVIEPDIYWYCTVNATRKAWFENNLEFKAHFVHDFYSLKSK